jgi:membrane associated rhomboid family serine protease
MGLFSYFPDNTATHDQELDKKIFRHSFIFAFFFVAVFWLVRIGETIFGFDLYRWGILPRHIHGLWGILFSPFIHSDFNHLISNTVPFFILLFALVYFYRSISYRIFFLIYFLSGLCVWIGGRESFHIGASGIVYGLVAFHAVSGIIRNDLRLLIISAIVIFLYGGLVWGILPLKPEVSWESHLWGAASGVLLAYYYRRYSLHRRKFDWEEEPDEEEEKETEEEVKLPENQADLGKSKPDDWWN